MWHSKYSCHLKCQHPRWVPVSVLAVLLWIQLPANGMGNAAKDGLGIWVPWMKLLALTWPNSGHCIHLGSE